MQVRWLVSAGVLLAAASCCAAQQTSVDSARRRPAGYLLTPTPVVRVSYPAAAQPYWPQPGDIVVYDNSDWLYHLAFKAAHTAPPTHAAMVIARADGTPALLELAGPHTLTATVCIMDVEARFASYPGSVMVRRIRQPITPEQSDDLRHFSEAQVGKRFALGRVFLLATPFCPREGWRREVFGRTPESRRRWFCSELVVAAGAAGHIYDRSKHAANGTVPRDLAVDETVDLSSLYHPAVAWTAKLPAE